MPIRSCNLSDAYAPSKKLCIIQEWFSESEASNGSISCPTPPVSPSLDRSDLSSKHDLSSSSEVTTCHSFEGQEQEDKLKDKVRAHDHHLQKLIDLHDDEKDEDADVHVMVSDCGTTLKLMFTDKKSRTILDDEVMMCFIWVPRWCRNDTLQYCLKLLGR